ncbi:MAG: BrnT family toxin [Acidobacteria bacterium]|nr:BrnT family toxin [Acidobacteriota bacterium]
MAEAIEFDWDEENRKHLKSHRVSPQEFEQVIANDPLDLEYQLESGEQRYKSLGVTEMGRALIIVWTLREGKVRAVTADPAGRSYEKLYRSLRG